MPRRAPIKRRRARERAPSASRPRLSRWSDERLLATPIRELELDIEGTWLREPIDQIRGELDDRGLRLSPHFWLSTEFFCPDGVPGVAIPFYLAHSRLMRLERKQMLEVEGGSASEFRRILRHEVGHAIQHAYLVHHKREYRRLFGRSSQPYPELYRPNPASKSFVLNLDNWYAQSHPDEDFAETFAVWLAPRSQWRRRYAGWPALKKLEYVDRVMRHLAGVKPKVTSRARVDHVGAIEQTVGEYYVEKRERYQPEYPDAYDRDLKAIFQDGAVTRRGEPAAMFLRRHRTELRTTVARWTGEYEYTLDVILSEMIESCKKLKLRAVGPKRRLITDFAVLLGVKTIHYVYRAREWHSL